MIRKIFAYLSFFIKLFHRNQKVFSVCRFRFDFEAAVFGDILDGRLGLVFWKGAEVKQDVADADFFHEIQALVSGKFPQLG